MNSIHVCLADTPQLQEKMYQLRYDVYTSDVPSFSKEELPQGVEKDAYDDYSVHIVACLDGEVIGTLRLIKDNPHGFLMEQAFKIPQYISRAHAVEHSRGIVSRLHRGSSVYTKMLDYAYMWQREHNYYICLGAPNLEKLHEILLAAGWKDFGIPKKYHNIIVAPMYYNLNWDI